MRAFLLAPVALAWALFPGITSASDPLGLDETIRLALSRQPLLEAQAARVHAAQERAVSAGELPDPQLVAGFDNVSVEMLDPYAADVEPMTMTTLGVMQEFPNAKKRRERARRGRLMADGADAELAMLERSVAREATLAWLEVWQPQQALTLVAELAEETRRQRSAAEIAYRSSRGNQSAVHASIVAQALIEDRQRQLQQSLAAAHARLARWIGDAAVRTPADTLPATAPLPPLSDMLAGIDQHPELRMSRRGADAAGAGVELARAAYRPDWRVQAMYGYRRPYDDMVSLQLGFDLPLFTGQRQDRELEAARAEQQAAEATVENRRRELVAAVESAYRESAALEARLDEYARTLLPATEARSAAALAAYRSGSGSLDEVLAARSAALDAQLMHLDLQAELQRQRVQLRYLMPSASEPSSLFRETGEGQGGGALSADAPLLTSPRERGEEINERSES